MPSEDRFRFHDQQRRSPVQPHAPEPGPEEAIGGRPLQPFRFRPSQHGQWLPLGEVLQPELGGSLEHHDEGAQHGEQPSTHQGEEPREFDPLQWLQIVLNILDGQVLFGGICYKRAG
jgi:hypothetical protein